MDIHNLKSAHGWREFLIDIAIASFANKGEPRLCHPQPGAL